MSSSKNGQSTDRLESETMDFSWPPKGGSEFDPRVMDVRSNVVMTVDDAAPAANAPVPEQSMFLEPQTMLRVPVDTLLSTAIGRVRRLRTAMQAAGRSAWVGRLSSAHPMVTVPGAPHGRSGGCTARADASLASSAFRTGATVPTIDRAKPSSGNRRHAVGDRSRRPRSVEGRYRIATSDEDTGTRALRGSATRAKLQRGAATVLLGGRRRSVRLVARPVPAGTGGVRGRSPAGVVVSGSL